jgi:hypothetical protein
VAATLAQEIRGEQERQQVAALYQARKAQHSDWRAAK